MGLLRKAVPGPTTSGRTGGRANAIARDVRDWGLFGGGGGGGGGDAVSGCSDCWG